MKAASIAVAAVAVLAVTPALAQQQPGYQPPQRLEQTPQPDVGQLAPAQEFIHQAIRDNIGDVELGRIARERADAPQSVRQLGNRIALDNIQFNGQLARLAQAQGVPVSNELLERDREALDRLSRMQGDQFTTAYLRHIVAELERDLETYRNAAQTLDDAQVRQFAESMVPRIEQQLQTARAVHDAQTAAAPGAR